MLPRCSIHRPDAFLTARWSTLPCSHLSSPDHRNTLECHSIAGTRRGWGIALLQLWSSAGLPNRCPWAETITSVAYIIYYLFLISWLSFFCTLVPLYLHPSILPKKKPCPCYYLLLFPHLYQFCYICTEIWWYWYLGSLGLRYSCQFVYVDAVGLA